MSRRYDAEAARAINGVIEGADVDQLLLIADGSSPLLDSASSVDAASLFQGMALRRLGKLRLDASAVERVEALLGHERFSVRLAAVSALGRVGDESAVQKLLALVERDEMIEPSVAEALGRIGSAESVPRLVGLLQSDRAMTRCRAAGALARMRARGARREVVGAAFRARSPVEVAMFAWHLIRLSMRF